MAQPRVRADSRGARRELAGGHVRLVNGLRGLAGGSSLTQLLVEHRGIRSTGYAPPLTIPQILAWADLYRAGTADGLQTGPDRSPRAPGETWLAIRCALVEGLRGLAWRIVALTAARTDDRIAPRNGSSFDLRAGHPPMGRRVPRAAWQVAEQVFRVYRPRPQVRVWRNHRARPSSRPSRPPREFDDSPVTRRASRASAQNKHAGSDDSADTGLGRCIPRASGRWPDPESGPIPESADDTWSSVHYALSKGRRGLSGGLTLPRLLDQERRHET